MLKDRAKQLSYTFCLLASDERVESKRDKFVKEKIERTGSLAMQLVEKRCLLSRAELLEPLEGLVPRGTLA